MKRRVLSAVIMTCLFAGLSLPVSAAPAVMEDGGIFDAAYYAEQNRDVSAVFGTDQTALYRHWLICGKQEGRQPYDPSYDIDSLLDLQPAVNVDYSTSLGKSMAWDPAFSAYSGTSTLPKGVAHIAWDKSGITEITLGTYAEKNPVTGYFFDPAAAPGRSYAVLKSFLYENGYRICKEESQQDTLSDLEICDKALSRLEKRARTGGDKEALAQVTALEKAKPALEEGKPLRSVNFTKADLEAIRTYQFLTQKPVMYIANVAEDGFENNPYLDEVREIAKSDGSAVVPVSAAVESDLATMDEADRKEFMESMGLEEPGLNRVIRAGYKLLGLQTFFTAGPKEVRAWTVRVGATAPEAAGKIHSDFEKGFIRAQTIAYDDFIKYQGEQGAKEAGKLRSEGKDYIVHDGDLFEFLFNV